MDPREKAFFCIQCALDKKALDPVLLDLQGVSPLADYFIICSGTSVRHIQAIAQHIEVSFKSHGDYALGIEGSREGKWVLLDYDDVIIHLFQEHERTFYDLENLWSECSRIPIPEDPPNVPA
ncbi:MAG: ribosome silencing factor [Deltaproteobacteria bacterium]|nr:ribosome silencing factor [Deltaproteobacteria bacterium]